MKNFGNKFDSELSFGIAYGTRSTDRGSKSAVGLHTIMHLCYLKIQKVEYERDCKISLEFQKHNILDENQFSLIANRVFIWVTNMLCVMFGLLCYMT